MKRAILALALLGACGRGAEEKAKLEAAIRDARAEIALLEKRAAALPALRQQRQLVETHLAQAGQFDGPNVPAILPDARVRSILESDVRGTGAQIAVTVRGPLKGRYRWEAKVKPPARVWQVAAGILGDRSTEPTRLLDLVDRSGLVQGYYPLIPSEDLDEKPLPPVLPRPPPVASSSTAEGRRLASELSELERRRVALVAEAAEAGRADANLQKLRGRQAVVDQVGDEMVRQRILLELAVRLGARKLRIREASTNAELSFDGRDAAMRARDSAELSSAGLTPTRNGDRLDVVFDHPPSMQAFEARRLAFVQQGR